MHFTCIQCRHEFCSGCLRPFRRGQVRPIAPYSRLENTFSFFLLVIMLLLVVRTFCFSTWGGNYCDSTRSQTILILIGVKLF